MRPPASQEFIDERQRFISDNGLDSRRRPNIGRRKPLVVIVTDTKLPQCFLFRVEHKLKILRRLGIGAEFVSPDDIHESLELLQFATALIFYRMPMSDLFVLHLEEARRLGLKVGYDIDDPLFDRQTLAASAGLAALGPGMRAHHLEETARFRHAMRLVDFIIVSTPSLAMLARASIADGPNGPPVFVWRNVLDDSAMPESANDSVPSNRVIGYFSGSPAHDPDFDVAAEALVRALERHPDLGLLIGGYVSRRSDLARFRGRVRYQTFVDYGTYLGAISHCDLVIIPLADDAFNAQKSAVRLLDAATMEKPAIASAVGDQANLVRHGETGWLARPGDWDDVLSEALADGGLLRAVGRAARRDLVGTFSLSNYGRSLDPTLLEHLRGTE